MVKYKYFTLFIYFFSVLSMKAQNKIENVVVFKNFLKAGNTNSLIFAFKNPDEYEGMIDTTVIKKIEIEKWINILKKANKKRHHQMKIANINFSGYMKINNTIHYYVVCSEKLIIDLTEKYNYWISVEDSKFLSQITSEINNNQDRMPMK